jgi:hypothetical protein
MLKPYQFSEDEPEMDMPEDPSPSFEKLMQLVFSRPIYLEPPDEPEEETESEDYLG